MNKVTLKKIEKHLPIIEMIVNNRSCSNIPITFREDLIDIAQELGIKYCETCNTGIFALVYRLHNLYNIEINRNKNVQRRRNSKISESSS